VFVARSTGFKRADAINIRIPIEGAEKTAESTGSGGPNDLPFTRKIGLSVCGMCPSEGCSASSSSFQLTRMMRGAEDLFRQRRDRPVDPLVVRPGTPVDKDVIDVHADKKEQ
jgi:hypothetical protein